MKHELITDKRETKNFEKEPNHDEKWKTWRSQEILRVAQLRNEDRNQPETMSDEFEEIKVKEFRAKIDEMVLSLENETEMQPRAWSAARKIFRFEQKLESAVNRMAEMGPIEEESLGECEDEKDLTVGGPSDQM